MHERPPAASGSDQPQLATRSQSLDRLRLGCVTDGAPPDGELVRAILIALQRRHDLADVVRLPCPDPGATNESRIEHAVERCDVVVVGMGPADRARDLLDFCAALEDRGVPCVLVVPAEPTRTIPTLAGPGWSHLVVVQTAESEWSTLPSNSTIRAVEQALATDPDGLGRLQPFIDQSSPDSGEVVCEC